LPSVLRAERDIDIALVFGIDVDIAQKVKKPPVERHGGPVYRWNLLGVLAWVDQEAVNGLEGQSIAPKMNREELTPTLKL
jgi:hypothetical protein